MSECRFGLLLLIVSLLLFFPPVMRCASIKKQASIMLPSSSSSSSFGFLASGFYFVWSRLTFVSAAFPWLPPHCAIQVASVDNNRSMVCERVSGKEAVCQAHALQDACPAAAFCPEGGIPLVLFSLAHIRFPLFGARSFPLLSLFRRQRGLGHLILRLLHCTLCIGALCSCRCCCSTLLSRLGFCASVYLKRSAHTENPSGVSLAPITIPILIPQLYSDA